MTFTGIHHQFASITFTGFDKKASANDIYALRLQLFLNVRAFMGWWQAESNALTVEEAWLLHQWLLELADADQHPESGLYFNEADLSFCALQRRTSGTVIRIDFNYDLRPDDADPEKQYYITVSLTDAELLEVASGLEEELYKVLEYEDEHHRITNLCELRMQMNHHRITNLYEYTNYECR